MSNIDDLVAKARALSGADLKRFLDGLHFMQRRYVEVRLAKHADDIDPLRTIEPMQGRHPVPQFVSDSNRTKGESGVPYSVGPYRILQTISKGGMGIVYKAVQSGLNREVALKMMLCIEHESASSQARFAIEARAAGSLDHPGIVSIHDVGDHNGQPYYVMDYVAGPTVNQFLDESEVSAFESVSSK